MNYKEEINKLLKRIPPKVINGSTNQAVGYKIVVEKALLTSRKARASEAELMRVLADLQAYE